MPNSRNAWWIAGAAALVITAAAGAGVVMAQEPSPSTAPTVESTPSAQSTPSSQDTPSTPGTPGDADPGHGGGPGGCGVKGVRAEALAGFLGINADQLRAELQADGATLATVAAAHGQDRDALINFLTNEVKTALDEKVAAGDITQEEADAKLSDFTANVDERIDASPAFGGRHMRPGGAQDGTSSGGTLLRQRLGA